MKINLKLISLILIIFFISLSVVCAEDAAQTDANVTYADDGDIDDNIAETETNNPTVEPKGFMELQRQIWNSAAGDTIELDSDYVYDGERNWISIGQTLTIDGKGHTLDGNNNAIFYVTNTAINVEIRNAIFINGQRSAGGAITADVGSDYLTIKNCTFKDNKATTSNVGGAVYIKSSYSTITSNSFENNYAPSSGGAIRLEGGNGHSISNNIFIGNKAENSLGGAINALGHNIKIFDNTFIRNVAGRDGGAISIEGTKVEEVGTGNVISNNVFESNRASGSHEGSKGGAISIAGKNCEVSNNNFTNNHADTLGGAIRWNGEIATAGKLTGNRFESNDAQSGGAIYVSNNGLTVSKNIFNNNKATAGAGGAINIKGSNNIITDNEITKSSTKTSGGGIYIDGSSNKITNNNIASCSAGSSGGAAYITGASATITGNKFTSNDAGQLAGATQIKSNSANIKNNEFSGNAAKSSGGAAYIEGAKITMDNNIFTKNQAGSTSVGGAVRFSGNDATITNNKYVENTANVGYGIYGSGELKKLSGNTYSPKDKNSERWEKTSVKLTTPTKTFKKTVKTKKVTITLKSANNKALSKKKITLTVNKKTYKGTTNSKGQATITVKLTKKGTFKYTAKFAGDTYYNALSKKGTIKIK